jgi:hypothetical protein
VQILLNLKILLTHKIIRNVKNTKILEFVMYLPNEVVIVVVPIAHVQQVIFTPHKYFRKKLLNFKISL